MKKFVFVVFVFFCSFIFCHLKCYAQQIQRDIAISAYIYNFAKNVKWQNEENIKEFHFLVIGDDENIVKELTTLSRKKSLRKKPISVTSSRVFKDAEDIQLIFVTKGKEETLEKIFDKIKGKNTLVISDSYKNKAVVMINFFDSEDGNLLFEINQANILNQNIEILPDMVLLGGSVVDVAALYFEGQKTLREIQKEIGTLYSNLAMLEKNIDNKTSEILSSKDSLNMQTQKIREQQVISDEQRLLIAQQKKELQLQIQKLLLQQKIFNVQSQELLKQKAELEKGTKALVDQKNEISKQKLEIGRQKSAIALQTHSIYLQNMTMQRQRYMLLLSGIIIILVIVILFTIYYAYRNKKRLNVNLEKRVLERTLDLNKSNKQLKIELSERKMAEKALLKSEERFRITLDNMLEGGQIIGKDWRYIYVNDAVAIQGNHSKESLIGRTMMEVYPGIENTELFSVLKKCLNEQTSEHLINEFKYGDGTSAWFELSIQPVPEGLFILSFDITERKFIEDKINKLNEELEEKVNLRTVQLENANKELEAFAYSVSHDLRAPLRAINGFTKILTEDYSDKIDEEGQRVCGIIQSEAIRMGQLIDDLLAFSRLSRSSLNLTATDMKDIVKSVYKEVHEQYSGHKIKIHIANLCAANSDPSLIRQVWVNLISNALKFSSKKEIIEINIGCYENPDEFVYFVKDNGAGFDMQYAHKLFGVFQRLHGNNEFYGTGVGLAIVQRIISRHGGRVWAEGEIDKGATFYFSLPK